MPLEIEAGQCPSAADVRADLEPLLSESARKGATATPVRVTEVGLDGYVVEVGAARKELVDRERNCRERARNVAVFCALVLEPPELGANEVAVSSPEKESAEGARAKAPPTDETLPRSAPESDASAGEASGEEHGASRGSRLRLEAGVGFRGGLLAEGAAPIGAPQLGVRGRWGTHIGVHVGAAYVLPPTLVLDEANLALRVVPFDVGVHVEALDQPVSVLVDAGFGLSRLVIESDRPESHGEEARLEASVRSALTLGVPLAEQLAGFLALEAWFVPRPNTFVIEPEQAVGTTPRLWLAANVGARFAP